jgi:hypothetical protein
VCLCVWGVCVWVCVCVCEGLQAEGFAVNSFVYAYHGPTLYKAKVRTCG